MNPKLKYWILAARPHTLTLGLACALTGNLAAMNTVNIDKKITFFSVLTTLLLQTLSNFANDFGDYKHGADNEFRIGPQRALQSGVISGEEMLTAIRLTALAALASGLMLLSYSLKNIGLAGMFILLSIGLLAIWAAYAYTAAKKPYGYKGWGDIFVFIFFGLVTVEGIYFLQSGKIHLISILPAIAMGFFSTAVLNLNNIRDIDNDRQAGKITVAVRLGKNGSAWYHFFLTSTASLLLVVYFSFVFTHPLQYLAFLPVFAIMASAYQVFYHDKAETLYPVLKSFSLLVLVFTICLWMALIMG